eukprot:1635224-Pleurochrysis_carterae.AAC.3
MQMMMRSLRIPASSQDLVGHRVLDECPVIPESVQVPESRSFAAVVTNQRAYLPLTHPKRNIPPRPSLTFGKVLVPTGRSFSHAAHLHRLL